jgi:hypothetical protein
MAFTHNASKPKAAARDEAGEWISGLYAQPHLSQNGSIAKDGKPMQLKLPSLLLALHLAATPPLKFDVTKQRVMPRLPLAQIKQR